MHFIATKFAANDERVYGLYERRDRFDVQVAQSRLQAGREIRKDESHR